MPSARERPRVAVVGHVEWVQFARVPHVPAAGEVVHAQAPFEEPAGGGAVAAVQLARLAGAAQLFTALGEDDVGARAQARLRELGVEVHAAPRRAPTRRAVTLVDDAGERTITTIGERLEPCGEEDALPWPALAQMDAVYFTAGDLAALRAARGARVLVASPRAVHALGHGVALDALVLSADDAIERAAAAHAEADAALVVRTAGAHGGSWRTRDGRSGTWAASPLPGPVVDSYGCGDSFAAGFAYGLSAHGAHGARGDAGGARLAAALALGARCGASCLTGAGPYARQLTLAADSS
jgi:ribokinase